MWKKTFKWPSPNGLPLGLCIFQVPSSNSQRLPHIGPRIDVPNSNINTILWTPILKWYVVRSGSKNGHQKDNWYKRLYYTSSTRLYYTSRKLCKREPQSFLIAVLLTMICMPQMIQFFFPFLEWNLTFFLFLYYFGPFSRFWPFFTVFWFFFIEIWGLII